MTLTASQQLRLNDAITTYTESHGEDDYSDISKRRIYYEEAWLRDKEKIIQPAIWLGFTINQNLLDVIFAQKNAGFSIPTGEMAVAVKILDGFLLECAAAYYCSVIRFAGRYGWQRYARSLGYASAHECSPRGYPYFVKII